MCDESWAIGMADAANRRNLGFSPALSIGFYTGIAVSLWLTWVISTGAGAVLGSVLGDITRWGFDMAFPALT